MTNNDIRIAVLQARAVCAQRRLAKSYPTAVAFHTTQAAVRALRPRCWGACLTIAAAVLSAASALTVSVAQLGGAL